MSFYNMSVHNMSVYNSCYRWGLAIAVCLVASCAALGNADARPNGKGVYRGPPPFCVVIRGPRGWDYPQICEFYNYRECLEAAIGPRRNCVVNIDFPGEVTRDSQGNVFARPWPRGEPPRR